MRMISKLVVEKLTQPPHFDTVSLTKHLYNTKQNSVAKQLSSTTKFFPARLHNKCAIVTKDLVILVAGPIEA